MRWRLTQKHYLNVPDTEWEYTEFAQGTRRSIKRKFAVPRHLDPEAPDDCNYNPGGHPRSQLDADRGYPGEIIVCHEGGGKDRDIVFAGPPTLDMVPLDKEAEELSAQMAIQWKQQFVDDGEGGYTGRLLEELTTTLNSFNAQSAPSGFVREPDPDIAELKGLVKDLIGAVALQARSERRI